MFYIQSVKTKRFFDYAARVNYQFSYYRESAKAFKTPSEAYRVLLTLSDTHKAKIVYFDGENLWNVSKPKA